MEFCYENVKNPKFFQENTLPAHSNHIAYRNQYEIMTETSGLRHSLNGLWKFAYALNEGQVIDGFEKEDFDCRNWDEIRVPAHIQMEGYGTPQYSNTTYPWEGRECIEPGQIPVEFNPVAMYALYFTLPESFKDNRVGICFKGVESGFALYLNGQYVGYSEDSFDASEFDLTPYLKEGENKLAVKVWKWTSGSWCEDQDFFRFSGIYRDVYLFSIPAAHISDVKIVPVLNDDFSEARVQLSIKGEGQGKVAYCLRERGGNKALISNGEFELSDRCSLEFSVENPKLWSAEDPNLYELLLAVRDEKGKVCELIPQNVGFRRFEMKDGIMCLNGKRIVFKGVNRHEFSSVTGRVPNREELIRDIVTMKQHNINAIRTSHYPDNDPIYELCDIYGLYMIAENNMETHGTFEAYDMGQRPQSYILPKDHEEWKDLLLTRVENCYEALKNHPAILIWSCGNESYGGKVVYEMSRLFREKDPYRLVHYEGIFHDRSYNDTSDMESHMYTSVADVKRFLEEHPEKPFIMCEYTHAMGNSCGAMYKYTVLSDREPRFQGGFIWDYVDQSLYKKDRYGNWFLGYGGDFDDRPNDGDFSGDGVVYGGERKPSPKMQEVKYNYQNIQVIFAENPEKKPTSFMVINKNLFVNTDRFKAEISLSADGVEVLKQPMEISVPPLGQADFKIPEELLSYINLANKSQKFPEFSICLSFRLKEDTLWAKAGHEVAFGQLILEKEVRPYATSGKPEFLDTPNHFTVKGANYIAIFSKMKGGIVSYKFGGVEMLSNYIPHPNFWRAPTANDRGNLMMQRYGQWKLASLYSTNRPWTETRDTNPDRTPTARAEEFEDSVKISFTRFLPTKPQAQVTVSYKCFYDGTIETCLTYDPVKELGDMPEFGMLFKIDADYEHLTWYGRGPEETYADRKMGGRLGLYSNLVSDNIAQYLVPQECGAKCDVRFAKVTDKKGRGLVFFGDKLTFSALPYTPHEIECADHAYELPQIHYTVVRVAEAQMGLAGDDSWGSRVAPEHLLDVSGRKEFTFCFRGI